MMKARLSPLEREFVIQPAQTVLRAAEAAGIDLPSACRNGTCRTCICLLTAGRVRHTIEWPGLSAEEKAEGWFLPCVAEPLGDIEVTSPLA
jgi:ferredoxin